MTTYYVASKCPFHEECNFQNFKSWQPWGWTEETCRAQVLRHLKNSGKHKSLIPPGENRDEEYKAVVEAIELSKETYDPVEHIPKKYRIDNKPAGKGKGKCSVIGQSSSSTFRLFVCRSHVN